MWLRAVMSGAGAGVVGAIVMTAAEKLEQRWTRRPDSHVPGTTLARLAGLPERPGRQPATLNLAMHLGQGALLGSLRGVMAAAGLRECMSSRVQAVVKNPDVLARVHGTFNVVGGVWPLVSLRTFERVFGPKEDKWL